MGRTLAYLRTSTDRQDLNHQKLEILEHARRHGLHVDDFVSVSISSRKNRRERKLDELLAKLSAGDTLVVTELSRLGRSTGEVTTLINELVASDIRVVVIKQALTLDKQQNDMQAKIMTTLLSLFAELERDLISLRTREALAAKKAQGVSLGKPKGTVQESIYDQDRERIVELLQYGVSARRISEQHLKYGHPSSLNYYIQTRQLRDEAQKRNGDRLPMK
jgi:DNA invertase Pin-like site-specific DNA recombinase